VYAASNTGHCFPHHSVFRQPNNCPDLHRAVRTAQLHCVFVAQQNGQGAQPPASAADAFGPVQQREKNTLHTIKELSCHAPYHQLHTDIVKTSIGLFVAEVLHKAVREEEADQPLYDFLSNALQVLDLTAEGAANFHLAFLMQLTRYLGFFPQSNDFGADSIFDLRDGVFRPSIPDHPLFADVAESRLIELLRELPFAALHELKLNAEQRRLLLVYLLRYYELHLSNMKDIRSHLVLSEVLG
jgi:DNA repair protein RecO (recombination protein O)